MSLVKMNNKDVRNSNFEFVRIIAMLMITGYHYVVHGNFNNAILADPQLNLFMNILGGGGKVGVNLFCLIMGYYSINKESVKYNKLAKMESQVLFYSLGGLSIGLLYSSDITIKNVLLSVMPIIFEQYWFISAYFIVFMISPYINCCINNLTNIEYKKFVIILLLIGSFIPFFTLRESYGLFWSQLNWFIIMYVIGGYMRKISPIRSLRFYLVSLILSSICLNASMVIISAMSQIIPSITKLIPYFRWSNSPIVVIISISIIRIIQIVRPKYNNKVNMVASLVFGIYLFQENIFIRKFLWDFFFINSELYSVLSLFLHYIYTVVVVFCIGAFVEFVRIHTIGRTFKYITGQ